MGMSLQYRELAHGHRQMAQTSTLPNIREKHLRSAAKWDILAEEAERFEAFSPISETAERKLFY